ncbi:MAG TPA: hypothetical protein PK698_02540 [Bacilli bacterium]|jgi:hypothetical protein|nr:hypothetical protein [Bacilli bacterium]
MKKNKCVSVQEIVPFKIISLNAFYTLLIEKKNLIYLLFYQALIIDVVINSKMDG